MINAYLNFPGTCEEAFKFYEQLFQGKIDFLQRHGDTPMKQHVESGWQNKVIHVSLSIAGGTLMGSDAPPQYYKPAQGFAVSVTLDVENAERVFKGLADGGSVELPFEKTFWAERFGSVKDRFGTPWMITGGHR